MITPADTPPSAPEQMPASTFDIQAPYAPGTPQDIAFAGSATSAGDDVAGTVAAAQAAAEARYSAHMQQTYGQGSSIGIPLTLPDVVSDHSLTTGGDGAGHPFEES
jgi:hypothetical protein